MPIRSVSASAWARARAVAGSPGAAAAGAAVRPVSTPKASPAASTVPAAREVVRVDRFTYREIGPGGDPVEGRLPLRGETHRPGERGALPRAVSCAGAWTHSAENSARPARRLPRFS